INAGIEGIEVLALQHLLPGPEPQRIILGLAIAPDLRDQHVGRQRDAAEQEQDIERRSQRRVSQHKLDPDIRRISILSFCCEMDCFVASLLAMTRGERSLLQQSSLRAMRSNPFLLAAEVSSPRDTIAAAIRRARRV